MAKSSFWADFKKFITRGNVMDLAVAVVVGGAFNKIVSGLVTYIITPLISLLSGGKNLNDWKWVIKEATFDEAGNVLTAETALLYGTFIQTIIDFLLIAFSVFIVIRIITKTKDKLEALKKKEEEAAPAPAPEPPKETADDILRDIRELLKARSEDK